MSASSYHVVQHEGGPLGGQQLRYRGEPSLRLSKLGGDYVREDLRDERGVKLREYRYRWVPAADEDGVQRRVPQDGDDASAMLEHGPVQMPEGASVAVGTSGAAKPQPAPTSKVATPTPAPARTPARTSKTSKP